MGLSDNTAINSLKLLNRGRERARKGDNWTEMMLCRDWLVCSNRPQWKENRVILHLGVCLARL